MPPPKCKPMCKNVKPRKSWGDQMYICMKCGREYDERSAQHNGLIGPGKQLREIIANG
jgi:hypothetical protein